MSSRWLGRGGTAQVGGSPYLIRLLLNHHSLFSLTPSAQRKKLSKKETPENYFAICGWRPTLRALDRRSLFEKSNAKTFNKLTALRKANVPFAHKRNHTASRCGFFIIYILSIYTCFSITPRVWLRVPLLLQRSYGCSTPCHYKQHGSSQVPRDRWVRRMRYPFSEERFPLWEVPYL